MTNFEILSSIISIFTLFLGIYIVFVFNRHTRDAENHTKNAEIHTKNAEETELKHAFLTLYNDMRDRVHSDLGQIYEDSIVKTRQNLKSKIKISNNDLEKLMLLFIKCNTTKDLIEQPLFDIDVKTDSGSISTNDFKTKFADEVEILKDFVENTSTLVFKTEKSESLTETIKNDNPNLYKSALYIAENLYISSIDTTDHKQPKNHSNDGLILMVAMRKNNTSKDWIDQSLGNWKVAKEKTTKIKYILGINVETRNIVSFAEVSFEEQHDDRAKFKCKKTVFKQEKTNPEKNIQIEEAIYWNPQNPIRYIKGPYNEIKESIEKQEGNEDSVENSN